MTNRNHLTITTALLVGFVAVASITVFETGKEKQADSNQPSVDVVGSLDRSYISVECMGLRCGYEMGAASVEVESASLAAAQ